MSGRTADPGRLGCLRPRLPRPDGQRLCSLRWTSGCSLSVAWGGSHWAHAQLVSAPQLYIPRDASREWETWTMSSSGRRPAVLVSWSQRRTPCCLLLRAWLLVHAASPRTLRAHARTHDLRTLRTEGMRT